MRDLDENQTTLISSNAGPVSSTLPASAKLYPKSISADGRYHAYGSSDLGSVRGDTNGVEDIYVRDLTTGTDPTNAGSVLSVMLLENLILHTVTIQWNSVPGRTYDVQYKDAVTEVWSDLFRSVLAEGDTRSVVDNSEPRPAQRFYRVVFVP